jgi:hypothetical protein
VSVYVQRIGFQPPYGSSKLSAAECLELFHYYVPKQCSLVVHAKVLFVYHYLILDAESNQTMCAFM